MKYQFTSKQAFDDFFDSLFLNMNKKQKEQYESVDDYKREIISVIGSDPYPGYDNKGVEK